MDSVRPIDTLSVRKMRQRLLRPHKTLDELIYDGDDHPNALHLGAFVGDELASVVSVCPQPPKGESDPKAWRLRGMATIPEHQGKGLGKKLVVGLLEHVEKHGASCIWCTSRVSAMSFYEKFGFVKEGEEFQIPVTGPHYVMRKVY